MHGATLIASVKRADEFSLPPLMPPRPKEIWIVELEDRIGHEQMGPHPAIVFAVHRETDLYIVVPLSSQPEATRFPCTYQIEPSHQNGLLYDSCALAFQVTCCDSSRFRERRLGTIEQMHYDRIATLIKRHMDL
jgi:mRNA-degrading endonuclease toxin of MazEF toxin-antitoxin module